ncbi:MAG: hypothetical protein AAF732_17700 [Pseudomonadota bacterium]
MIRDVVLGLVSLVCVLGALFGWTQPSTLQATGFDRPDVAQSSTIGNKLSLPRIKELELSQLRATLQKPVFFPDRRIPKPKAISSPKKPNRIAARRPQVVRAPSQFKLRLLGVVLSGDTQRALVLIDGRKPFWVKVGDRLNREWRVARIETNKLTAIAGRRQKAVQLYPDR